MQNQTNSEEDPQLPQAGHLHHGPEFCLAKIPEKWNQPEIPIFQLHLSELTSCPDLYQVFDDCPSLCSLELRFSTSSSSTEESAFRGLDLAGAKMLSKCLSISQCLLRLSLPGNNITDDTLSALYTGLRQCLQLADLDLSRNRITDSGIKLLSHMFRPEYCLMNVDLSHNKIGSMGCSHLALSLHDSICLESLNLSVNRIEDKGAIDLFSCLCDNETVETISLSCNRLSQHCIPFLTSLLKSNQTLTSLDLSGNWIDQDLSGDNVSPLLESLRHNLAIDLRGCGVLDEKYTKRSLNLRIQRTRDHNSA